MGLNNAGKTTILYNLHLGQAQLVLSQKLSGAIGGDDPAHHWKQRENLN